MRYRKNGIHYAEADEIEPSNLTKNRVESFAEQVAKFAEFEIGDNPKVLVKRLGGRILYRDTDNLDESGSVFVHSESDFDILLPLYTSPLRDRFTIGHELGHYFLHSNQGEQPIVAFRLGSGRVEWEANWFAAALLMPRKEFAAFCKKTEDLARIAAKFGVSQDAARVRRESL